MSNPIIFLKFSDINITEESNNSYVENGRLSRFQILNEIAVILDVKK